MASDQSQSDRTAVAIVGLLRRGCWAAIPIGTIESLIAGGRVVDFPSGRTVYTEADAERLAVMMRGLLRVYMHAGDGRQVTVRYARAGDLLGAPALIGGPAPVFVQAVTHGTAFFFDIDRVKRAARNDASLAWALAEESVHRLYDVLEELAGNTFASVRAYRTPPSRPRNSRARIESNVQGEEHGMTQVAKTPNERTFQSQEGLHIFFR